jgi:Fic family protein
MLTPKDCHWGMSPNKSKALMLAQRDVSVFVYDAVRLEGINFTLPEIQTLLQGITIGGHRLSDQQIAVNQGKAWEALFILLGSDRFQLSQDCACYLHSIAAKEEALEWGQFRTGGVLIAGTDYEPPDVGDLPSRFDQMVQKLSEYEDVYDQAIHVFLTMARNQFFYDVNKRTGRLMMNGHLLSHGFPAINVPATRQLEFNELMLRFYETGDMAEMNHFMRSCLSPKVVKIMNENR